MSTHISKKQPRTFVEEAKARVKKHGPAPATLVSKKDKTYTNTQLEDIQTLRHFRYLDLLTVARSNDMGAFIMFPTAAEYEMPMGRVSHTLKTQVELLDIYHYLNNRKKTLPFRFSLHSFGPAIGVDIKRSTLQAMLKREQEIRAAAKSSPPGAHYIVNHKCSG